MSRYYKLDGHKVVPTKDVIEWGEWFESARDVRRVADTELADARISTVFLAIDHNWSGHGPPVLFETMVFGGELDGEQRRYCTWEEAERGHAEMVMVARGVTA